MLIALVLVAFTSVAQVRTQAIALDTVKGAKTKYFTPTFTSTYVGVTDYVGVVAFTYTTKDIRDSLSYIKLQGSLDGTNYVDVSSQARTTTDGNYMLSQTPPTYLKYRIAIAAIAGDTVVFKNVYYIHKK